MSRCRVPYMVVLLFAFWSTTLWAAKSTSDTELESGKLLVGYFPQWNAYSERYALKELHESGVAKRLTHLVYAFGNVVNGRCVLGDEYADYQLLFPAGKSLSGTADLDSDKQLHGNFGQLRRFKELYPDIKVLYSFGGWSWSSGFGEAAASPETFADSCYKLINDSRWRGVFDGIDIDWEYPNTCGQSCDKSGFSGYPKLMKALRERFPQQLVTAALGASEEKLKAADYAKAAEFIDFYMLMTYDYVGDWMKKGPVAPHSALWSHPSIGKKHGDHSIQLLTQLGIDKNKILLGVGFYGRGWDGVNSFKAGSRAKSPAAPKGMAQYHELTKKNCQNSGLIAGVAYAYCDKEWWSFDSPASLPEKVAYVKEKDLAGMFVWEISGDTSDAKLMKSIVKALNE
ncbi:glycoside hydrolase family 18 protein [Teredinibacter sp. KSP-S5-2]|uniref:glycoside hydrolase family 18 protein n=1 Tax=Teredinibacter sp. KSP-S5-2 TaxID=3034506 RepID=UPI002934F1A7|nr:glycosyl hydrolase family 18 protein [Teredinibacter sp. KSP-S5-2]WNO08699.1 glycosyl hydrolase family 18 protein [Teredinibacter sp. KSP-S5-2]